jgi:uncharacterized protein YndB with AHSA1/START domain
MVFKAWTDPRQLAQWWGPKVFTNTCQVDARPGGAYRIVMQAPDGARYPMKGIFKEVVANRRLSYTVDLSEHPKEWQDMIDPNRRGVRPDSDLITTVTFEDEGGKTKMTIHMRFDVPAARDAHVKGGMAVGWSESFEKLDALLAPK